MLPHLRGTYMSAHYRELTQLLESYSGRSDIDAAVTHDEVNAVKQLLADKTLAREDANSNYFRKVHEYSTLCDVCNVMLNEVRVRRGTTRPAVVEDVRYIDDVLDADEERLCCKFLAVLAEDPEMRAILNRQLTAAAVRLHYATARPRQFDMFVHLSASEMFFIDGDSLLLAALASQQTDWDLTQPLHVMYNAQALLHRMQSRGARFHVIFFENQLWFWKRAPQKLFIRENLRLALMHAAANPASTLVVDCFESYHCPAFEAYVQQHEPEFFLVSDGEQLGHSSELHRLYENHPADAATEAMQLKCPYRSYVEDEAHGDTISLYYHCLQSWAIAHRVKVGYSSRIISRENAIIVFAVTIDSSYYGRSLALVESAVELAAHLEQDVTLPTISDASRATSEDGEVTLRDQVIAGAVHAYLNTDDAAPRSEQQRQLCIAFVVSVYSAGLIGAELRAQRAASSPEVTAFLNDIAPYMTQILYHRGCTGGRGVEFDLYDGHLLAILVHHLRTTSIADLLDADGVADVNYSWSTIAAGAADITSSPLSALPEVTLQSAPAVIQCPRFTHELVERLAKAFAVDGHAADRAFPAGLGNANSLSGWVVSHPFDELNDVVDAEAERMKAHNMTERDRKRLLKLEADFVTDAAQQAESMGIRGFTADRLAVVCSESDDEEADKNAERKVRQQHAGQRNKRVRSREEIIREEANVRDANRNVRDWYVQVESVLQSTDLQPDRTDGKDRTESMNLITAAINRMMQTSFGKNFDPGVVLKDAGDVPIELDMWRLLVETSGMREAEFAFAIDENPKKAPGNKRSGKSGATENITGLRIITKLVECIGGSTTNWGKLERLRTIGGAHMTTIYDAMSYLSFVYLTYVQIHFQLKLHCRVVKLQLDNWKAERERARLAQETPDITVGTPLFLYCHHKVFSTIRDSGVAIAADDLDTVRSALMHFDFPVDYYEKVDRAIATWQNKPVPVLLASLRPRVRLCFETPEIMQLTHMGHLLQRPIIPQRDYRVVFNPDGWQRDLLDIVDARGSAVVCAPTSAGKTFISYYCMYNALKTSNTKVVVYLAPNRALINQAVADVCARYGSKKYALPGKNVYGVHGGADYHRYHDSCQVLVTLPEILETLLLSPKYQSWVERLDYVILDEIHTMESSGNGDVWERVLALLPCPFVALSATLGETQELCGWLNRVQQRLQTQQQQKKRDYLVHSIPKSGTIQRWNDIKKYIYLPPPGYVPQLKKLTAKYEHRYIQDLHPLSILTLDQLHRGFPPDVSLVPSEVLQLHEKMVILFEEAIFPNWSNVAVVRNIAYQLQQLNPETYFQAENYITQTRARQYEADVKNAFAYWVVLITAQDAEGFDTLSDEELTSINRDFETLCQRLLSGFSQHLRENEKMLDNYAVDVAKNTGSSATNRALEARDGNGAQCFPESKVYIRQNIISVLRELNTRGMGPTIVFSFESEDCNDLVESIVEQLEKAEAAYRRTEEFAQYQAMMERKAAAQEAARKQRESTLKQKRLTTDDNGEVERADRDVDMGGENEELFIVPDVLPEFTFIGQNCTIDPIVVQSAIDYCEKRGDALAARAIRRGVGIHHAEVKGKIRRQMEILFRGRHCGVICATETLALGVHSPCRSVVLAGDHVLLNTTQFRQMMGRAGRRGLDFLGHVVFLSVSMKKITRLMTSSMTVIKGNVQMDVLTQLRSLQLFDYASHRDPAKSAEAWKSSVTAMVERMVINPLFFEGRARVEGGNMEAFTVEWFQMLLGFFQKEGLHFRDRPSSLGSLLVDVMHIFRSAGVGVEGVAFTTMLTRGIFAEADYPVSVAHLNSGAYGSSKQEAVAELLAYLFSVHKMCGVPLEVHRSVLSDPAVALLWNAKRSGGSRQHRVVLTPLRLCSPAKAPLDLTTVYRVISAFYTSMAGRLVTAPTDRLPFMAATTRKKNPIFSPTVDGLPLTEKLKATAVPFAARTPFVALSGCGDNFVNLEDLVTTLRNGLFCDYRLLPVLDLTDGCRHDGAQVLINACVADFARCGSQFDPVRSNYRFTHLEDLNGLTQSESFAVLSSVERLLSNIAGVTREDGLEPLRVLDTIFPEEVKNDADANAHRYLAGADVVSEFAVHLHGLRNQIEKNYAYDHLLRKQAETQKRRNAEKN